MLNGFGNIFQSEAISGALPTEQNSPQRTKNGLYAEQFSGSPFTAPRAHNFKTWMYKLQPSVVQAPFVEVGHATWFSDFSRGRFIKTPQALRFHPFPEPARSVDFWESIQTYAINGTPDTQTGCAIHLYSCNRDMGNRYAYNADAEMMIIPQHGTLSIHTELGNFEVAPLSIAVIPRGMKFKIDLQSKTPSAQQNFFARGYLCENFGIPFRLPELGPIGANGLANPRHFESPIAEPEDRQGSFELLTRYQGSVWRSELTHSPLNTVAWHGNLVPYRYDLRKFNTINSVTYDHPDPSIFTVLTSPTAVPGTANIDFAIFPPRWMVAENTFRPPYYHRNVMSEFMGLIQGHYDAKPGGFLPAGASIHNCMTGHGPDAEAYSRAIEQELKPERYRDTMAFMWESAAPFATSKGLIESSLNDVDYWKCWQNLKPAKF